MAGPDHDPLAFAARARPPGSPRPSPPPDADRWIVTAVVVVALLLTGLLLWRAEHRALGDPVNRGERGLVVGAEGLSLLREANLRRVLEDVGRRLDEDEVVTDLELTPVLARLSVRDAEAHQRSFTVGLDLRPQATDSGTNPGEGPRLAQVDAGAPARLVAAALRSGPYPAQTVTQVAWRYDASEEQQHWDLTLRDVPIADQNWTATGSASRPRRIRDPEPPAASPAGEPISPTTTVTVTVPAPVTTPAPVRPPRPPGGTSVVPGPGSGSTVVRVGGTTIVTDPAAGRRLQRCLKAAGSRRAKVQSCVNALGR